MNSKTNHKINEKSVQIPSGQVVLEGNLAIPEGATGIVLFAHGSGSSRHSPRNRFVAEELQREGLGTLLMDLLTPSEEAYDLGTGELRFNIEFLAGRLVDAIDWLVENEETTGLNIGLFGSSTGAAGALVAAVQRPQVIKAVVSRGGRPDLAESVLSQVLAPTLLIVGGYDDPVIEMNQSAFDRLEVEKEMTIVPRATHLFEESGALEEVARLAKNWFIQKL
ncbi:MAG: alpha/beta hydrolase [Phycisphaerae bacterium]|jgi:putative phosphoribosyl transferase|nr:alpha/beta hydrolase [Phycisphaerae bacterium]